MSNATPEASSASAPDKDEAASLENTDKPRRARGFAAMDRTRQKEIARKGGRAAHARGTAHRFDADEAREAGRKGGAAVSKDRSHMAEIGRAGGLARQRRPSNGPNEPGPN